MKEIDKEEMQVETQRGAGFTHFMGGTETTNGAQIVNVGGRFLLFSKEDMAVVAAYQAAMFELEKEAREYLKSQGYTDYDLSV